jgi:hypothetical protein
MQCLLYTLIMRMKFILNSWFFPNRDTVQGESSRTSLAFLALPGLPVLPPFPPPPVPFPYGVPVMEPRNPDLSEGSRPCTAKTETWRTCQRKMQITALLSSFILFKAAEVNSSEVKQTHLTQEQPTKLFCSLSWKQNDKNKKQGQNMVEGES